ncbi:MAG: 50S ribosomal protein L6 [Candidatus Omnitrophica bacterium]|nr:50S ribosomal protein L6 [Candidatus Omnitrophota bacterium]
MSKIGRRPIDLPKEVKLEIKGSEVSVKGPKGNFSYRLPNGVTVKLEEQKLSFSREADTKQLRAFHGLARSLVANMITGVSKGFVRELEIVGVGYKAQFKDNTLVLQLGFSHPVEIPVWKDLKVACPSANLIVVEGVDKQRVGQFVAQIRGIMPPEPYKGKGIRYKDEQVRKKLGKAMAKGQ